MKPHLAFINQTMAKKKAAEEAKKPELAYDRYQQLVIKAQNRGALVLDIIFELKQEKTRIAQKKYEFYDDPIIEQGIRDATASHLEAIDRLIKELEDGRN